MIKLKLTKKFFESRRSGYYSDWPEELTDIWKPTRKEENVYLWTTHSNRPYNTYGLWVIFDGDFMEVELYGNKKSKSGKTSVYLEDYVELIEEAIEVCTRLVQHGYAEFCE